MNADEHIRILLVEDSPSDAQLIAMQLEEALSGGFELMMVETYREGVGVLSRAQVDLVLLDLTLPDSSGFDTFLKLYQRARDVPIVVLSGLDDADLAVRAVREGAQDYVVKGRTDRESIGRVVRFSIERMRRVRAEQSLRVAEQQIDIARQVQQRLYPVTDPNLPGIDISGHAYPAEATCGDYFDYVQLPDDSTGVVVGDVSGHGLGPALLMVETRSALLALARRTIELGEILTAVNEMIVRDAMVGRFVSVFFARIDPQERLFAYASAGHRGYLLNAAGEATLLDSTGPVLGLVSHAKIELAPPIALTSGDIVILPTDGIEEAMVAKEKAFGMNRMLDVVRANRHLPAASIVHALYRAAREHCRGAPQTDDITAVVLKVKE